MIDTETPLNSKEGIEYFIRWARAHRVVVNEQHCRIAKRFNVSTDGILVARLIPL